jgi:isopenicillin-N N-acyltransferase-like protein
MKLKRLSVSGTHYACGQQIGRACAESYHQRLAQARAHLPEGLRWDDYRRAAEPYLVATERAFPWVVEEIRGAADGAGIDFTDLFVEAVEEISVTPPLPAEAASRCSDFAACAPATEGHVLLAHNNDLSPSSQDHLVAVDWDLPDQPRLVTVGVGGIFVSIGVNAAKVALTGNELSPNDDRIGVPRLLIARAILSARTFDEAVNDIALHPDRASSYNNLISTGEGQIASVEGSATDYEVLRPEEGWLVHTNHYLHPRMQKYERYPDHTAKSVSRYERAHELMRTRPGPVTLPLLQSFLADHNSSPATLCRHDEKVKTVFSALIDLTEGTMDAAVGNPCEGEFERVWG